MENPRNSNHHRHQAAPTATPQLPPESKTRPAVWDCGSALYDSVELSSFQRHLDSAISASTARTLSMPHLTDHRRFPPSTTNTNGKKPAAGGSKLSRSFQKLLRTVFFNGKSNASNSTAISGSAGKKGKRGGGGDRDELVEKEARWFVVYEDDDDVVYEKNRRESVTVLSTIAEVPETEKKAGIVSQEIGKLARKTMSERFTAASISNINMISSCA